MGKTLTNGNGLSHWPASRGLYGAPQPAVEPRAATVLGRAPRQPEAVPAKRPLINHLLNALPGESFERLRPLLEPVALSPRERVPDSADARHVYFPENAVVSHLIVFEEGTTVETAMTGREGALGLGLVLRHEAPTHWLSVTLPGSALRMRAEHFRQEFAASEPLRRLVLEHAGRHLAQVSQRAACFNRHCIEKRLATWLLLLDDRAGAGELPLTQEFISQRVGARRAGISEVLATLHDRGLLGHSRGLIRLLDRPGLEAVACECYAFMRRNWPREVGAGGA